MRESWEYYNDIATRYDYMYEEPYGNFITGS